MPYNLKKGAQSSNAGKHPYAKNNFKGTLEIQETFSEIITPKTKHLIRDGKKVYITSDPIRRVR